MIRCICTELQFLFIEMSVTSISEQHLKLCVCCGTHCLWWLYYSVLFDYKIIIKLHNRSYKTDSRQSCCTHNQNRICFKFSVFCKAINKPIFSIKIIYNITHESHHYNDEQISLGFYLSIACYICILPSLGQFFVEPILRIKFLLTFISAVFKSLILCEIWNGHWLYHYTTSLLSGLSLTYPLTTFPSFWGRNSSPSFFLWF